MQRQASYCQTDDWRCGDLSFPFAKGERRVFLRQSRAQEKQELLRLGLLFALLTLGSLALVGWLSWIAAARAARIRSISDTASP